MHQHSVDGLFAANRGALVEYARIVGNPTYAEDFVQEAWLRFETATRGRVLEQPLGYLYRIVRNLARDGRRRERRERHLRSFDNLGSVAEFLPDTAPSPEATALYKDEINHLMTAIAELPRRNRVAVEMHRFGGCKLKEIAAFIGVSIPMAHILVTDGNPALQTPPGLVVTMNSAKP